MIILDLRLHLKLCDGVYRLEKRTLDKINLKIRKSLMFSVLKQSFIYTMLYLFETSNCPNLYCFEITYTKQCYTISRISLKQPRFNVLNGSRHAECSPGWIRSQLFVFTKASSSLLENDLCFTLRNYATHLFTTPLSNDFSDNMMSRLILTLTKQFFDNQFTHLRIKTWKKSFVYNASL